MPTTTSRRDAGPKTTTRADQLRPLNLPRRVTVELNDIGLPKAIADSSRTTALGGDSSGGPSAGSPVRISTQSNNEGTEAIDSAPPSKAVETIIETWHVHDEWWRDAIRRRYVEVILEGGKHVVLYEDLNTSDWFMQMP